MPIYGKSTIKCHLKFSTEIFKNGFVIIQCVEELSQLSQWLNKKKKKHNSALIHLASHDKELTIDKGVNVYSKL